MQKTNAMRRLDAAKIPYEVFTYEVDESDLSGTHIAETLGLAPETVFKTIVTHGERSGYRVFCLPVMAELDLKKCAVIACDKRLELIPVKDILSITGYIRGGCSPIGMKKAFPTVIHDSAEALPFIHVSGGLRGLQIRIEPKTLARFISARFADIIHTDKNH